MSKLLNKKQAEHRISHLEFNWQAKDKSLLLEAEVKDFSEGVWVIDEIAKAAAELNHHPDIALENYNQLTILLSTHSAGGITDKDLSLAEKIDAIISRVKR